MKRVFIETRNVQAFRTALREAEDMDKGQPGLVVVHSRAGRGKTAAAVADHSEHGGIYLRVWQDWSQHSFLQALAFEACGVRPHGANNCKVRIVEALGAEPRTIYVDEADRLRVGRIEDLRDIHDETGCPVVLIGEEGLPPLLRARRRLWSRVVHDMEFGPVTPDDVLLYAVQAASLRMTPEACSLTAKRADGDFRLVTVDLVALERVARAAETDQVSADMVRSLPRRRS